MKYINERLLADYIHRIPSLTMAALISYVEAGIPTGDFLRAVLSNDLCEAVGRADADNRRALPEIVQFIYNGCPGQCWGDAETVDRWLADRFAELEGGAR